MHAGPIHERPEYWQSTNTSAWILEARGPDHQWVALADSILYEKAYKHRENTPPIQMLVDVLSHPRTLIMDRAQAYHNTHLHRRWPSTTSRWAQTFTAFTNLRPTLAVGAGCLGRHATWPSPTQLARLLGYTAALSRALHLPSVLEHTYGTPYRTSFLRTAHDHLQDAQRRARIGTLDVHNTRLLMLWRKDDLAT